VPRPPSSSVFVRRGTWSIPPLRKTEATDEHLADSVAYIADSATRAPSARRR
jgi:hypothetical protein